MNFEISCDTFYRLGQVALSAKGKENGAFDYIFIEHRNGQSIAVATNMKLAVIERLGNTTEPDGYLHCVVTDAIVAQAGTERAFHSSINYVSNEALKFASAKTTLGFNFTEVAARYPDTSYFYDWRSWLPDKTVTKNKGGMFWSHLILPLLVSTSPSGFVVFPEHIDVAQPVIIRDNVDPNWLGVFMPSNVEGPFVPAKLPDWIKK